MRGLALLRTGICGVPESGKVSAWVRRRYTQPITRQRRPPLGRARTQFEPAIVGVAE